MMSWHFSPNIYKFNPKRIDDRSASPLTRWHQYIKCIRTVLGHQYTISPVWRVHQGKKTSPWATVTSSGTIHDYWFKLSPELPHARKHEPPDDRSFIAIYCVPRKKDSRNTFIDEASNGFLISLVLRNKYLIYSRFTYEFSHTYSKMGYFYGVAVGGIWWVLIYPWWVNTFLESKWKYLTWNRVSFLYNHFHHKVKITSRILHRMDGRGRKEVAMVTMCIDSTDSDVGC